MFRPEILFCYNKSGSKLPLNTWVEVVGKNLPQFKNMNTLYRDIPIAVSLSHSGEAVKLAVSPDDANWYNKLVNVVQDMTGKRNIEIVNYLGTNIKDMTPKQLLQCSLCEVVDKQTKSPVRIASLVEPPKYMSSNKHAELKSWWTNNRENLAKEIANQLKSMTMDEIAAATRANGPVQQAIEQFLERNTLDDATWQEFTSTYGSGKMEASDMAKKLLESVKLGLRANERVIRDFHAANAVGASALWSKSHNTTASKYKDDFTLYRDIMEDVVYKPDVSSNVVNGILYGKSEREQQQPIARKITSSVNPIQMFYREYYYPIHGKMPSHIMDDYIGNKSTNNYPGDPKRAFDMFNLFSGKTIDCGCSGSKKKKQQQQQMEEVKMSLPPLVPIASHMRHKSKKHSMEDVKSSLPPLVPIASAALPPLVPIESHMHHKSKSKKHSMEDVKSSLPPLVPIASAALPPLVPIASAHACHLGSEMPDLIQKKMPAKRNIGKDWNKTKKEVTIPTDAQLNESPWVDNLPSISDF